jgi:60 kDa SS-A/Ro ribonucleoprotein
MIRNLGVMSANGLLVPFSEASQRVVNELSNADHIRKSRLHPMNLLVALKTYSQGHGEKGHLSWNTVPQVVDALDVAFYLSFGNVEPSNKRFMLAIDVSASMNQDVLGTPNLSCSEAAAAMAMITVHTEPNYVIKGFSTEFVSLDISRKMRLNDVATYIDRLTFGGTDCSLPMVWATKNKFPVDIFVVYTDNETWSGSIHPSKALVKYREQVNPNAKLVVMGMATNDFSIADPTDRGMLDVAGFDTSVPQILTYFANDKI